jgi:hypothetical protein
LCIYQFPPKLIPPETEIKEKLITKHKINGHQLSWGYEDGPWKGPGPPLLAASDFIKRIF